MNFYVLNYTLSYLKCLLLSKVYSLNKDNDPALNTHHLVFDPA